MAIDTRNKRASALGIGLALALTLPAADGTIDQGDRQQIACCYRGILAGAPVVVVPTVHPLLQGSGGLTLRAGSGGLTLRSGAGGETILAGSG